MSGSGACTDVATANLAAVRVAAEHKVATPSFESFDRSRIMHRGMHGTSPEQSRNAVSRSQVLLQRSSTPD